MKGRVRPPSTYDSACVIPTGADMEGASRSRQRDFFIGTTASSFSPGGFQGPLERRKGAQDLWKLSCDGSASESQAPNLGPSPNHNFMSNRISIAVIGAGKNSRNTHLPILKELQDRKTFHLSIVCDINDSLAESVRAEFGFDESTPNADVIFERDEVDAVYVIGTTQMHFEYAKRALLSGKHVFVEKPPTPRAEDALELMRLANRHDRVAVVGFNRRFEANINAAKERVGQTGRIYGMVGTMSKAAIDRPLKFGSTSWIQADGIHTIDALVYLMGEPPTELHSTSNSAMGTVPQNAAGVLMWADGTYATFSLNNSGGHRTERYEIYGSGVSYCCDNGTLTVNSKTESEIVEFGKSPRARGFVGEHEESQPRSQVSWFRGTRSSKVSSRFASLS